MMSPKPIMMAVLLMVILFIAWSGKQFRKNKDVRTIKTISAGTNWWGYGKKRIMLQDGEGNFFHLLQLNPEHNVYEVFRVGSVTNDRDDGLGWSIGFMNEERRGPYSVSKIEGNRITKEYRIDYSTNLAERFWKP